MSKTIPATILISSMAVLLGAAMIANPIGLVNAQGNQSQGNQTNATGGAANATGGEKKVAAAVKIDVDPLMKALKDAYPKLSDVKDPKGFVDAMKDIKDPKEVIRNMVAAGLMQNLDIFKSVQDMQ